MRSELKIEQDASVDLFLIMMILISTLLMKKEHSMLWVVSNVSLFILITSAQIGGQFGSVPLKVYHKNKDLGFKSLTILDVSSCHPLSNEILLSFSDLLWLLKNIKNILHLYQDGIALWNK